MWEYLTSQSCGGCVSMLGDVMLTLVFEKKRKFMKRFFLRDDFESKLELGNYLVFCEVCSDYCNHCSFA